jgi:hypothetical protein
LTMLPFESKDPLLLNILLQPLSCQHPCSTQHYRFLVK